MINGMYQVDYSALLWYSIGAILSNGPAMSIPYTTIALVYYRTGTGPPVGLFSVGRVCYSVREIF